MQRNKSQFRRLLELDGLIRARKYPNCRTFSEQYEVSQKTVQRDIDFLRDQLNAPLAYDRAHKGYYYENDAWLMPALLISEGELLSILLASRLLDQYKGSPIARDLQRIMDKLAGLLPDKMRVRPEYLYARFSVTSPPTCPIKDEVWSAVVKGLMERRTISVKYLPLGVEKLDSKKESHINPWHMVNLRGEWYLLGTHEGHSDIRQFNLGRMLRARLTDRRFEVPPDFDPDKCLEAVFYRFMGEFQDKPMQVRLLFDKEMARDLLEREWHPAQRIVRRKDGRIMLSFPAKGMLEVLRWVLSWGRFVEVLAPPALKKLVADEVRLMAKRACRKA